MKRFKEAQRSINRKKVAICDMTLALIMAIYALVAGLLNAGVLNSYYSGILIMICINIIPATSLDLPTGFLGQLILGHAGFMSVGAYAAALFTLHAKLPDSIDFPIALLVGGLTVALFSLLIDIPALRLKGDYLATITLGFGEIIHVIIINLDFAGDARGLRGTPRETNFSWVYLLVVLTVAIIFAFVHTWHDRAVISIREDETAAKAFGANTTYYKLLAFIMSVSFAEITGGLYAHHIDILNPSKFNFDYSVEILVMVVLDGMGSITGSVTVATVFTTPPEALRDFSSYRILAYSVVLVYVVPFRPSGLLGQYEFSLTRLFGKLSGSKGNKTTKNSASGGEKGAQRMPLLKAEHLGIAFGGLHALEDINFQLEENQVMGLIGPNGAGKTTVFNLLTQVYQPIESTIEFEGRNIIGKKTYDMTRGGIVRTLQNTRLFGDISVLDNVRIAVNYQMKYSTLAGILRLPSYWKEGHAMTERAMNLLSVFNLQEYTESRTKNLPYDQQRRLEIAHTLAVSSKVLLPDEPAADMNPTGTRKLVESIQLIRSRFPVSILPTEYDMSFAMGIYQHLVVLGYGRVIAESSTEKIRTNPKMITAYLRGE